MAAHGFVVDKKYFYKAGSVFEAFQSINNDLRKQKFLSELYQQILGEKYEDAIKFSMGTGSGFLDADVQ